MYFQFTFNPFSFFINIKIKIIYLREIFKLKKLKLLTTILFGVTSSGLAPRTGVAGALPLLHAFSYDVSEK